MLGKYFINILMGLDVLANTITFGKVETISSRIGKLKRDGKLNKHPIYKALDKVLEAVDKNHSIDAIDTDAQGYEIKIPPGTGVEHEKINPLGD